MTRTKRPPKYAKNYIKQLREARGLTIRELSEKLNTTHQNLSNLENSQVALTYETMEKLAMVFQCHPLEIAQGPFSDTQTAIAAIIQSLPPEQQQTYLQYGNFLVRETNEKQIYTAPTPASAARAEEIHPLRHERQDVLKLSLEKFSKAVGISVDDIVAYEAGEKDIPEADIKKICAKFKIDPALLRVKPRVSSQQQYAGQDT
jgi:transcriptional regulator with XRE-family HTH domain